MPAPASTTAALAEALPPHVRGAGACASPIAPSSTVARELFPHALRPSSLARGGQRRRRARASDRAARKRRHRRSRRGDRAARRDRQRHRRSAPTAVIGADVRIGRDCAIGAGRRRSRDALIGDRVIIHPGCKIGQDGFGYRAGRRAATSRCRRSAASSSRTTSRSAPAPPSTAAPSATP